MIKDKETLTDEECAGEAVCTVHHQPIRDCANQRQKYVKAAREMEKHTMDSARTWQKVAHARMAERDKYKAALDALVQAYGPLAGTAPKTTELEKTGP
jgi:acetyl-CoA carboxylase alpha subunit